MPTTMSTALVSQLKTIIADDLDVNLTVEEIDDNVSLFEEGLGFDSMPAGWGKLNMAFMSM